MRGYTDDYMFRLFAGGLFESLDGTVLYARPGLDEEEALRDSLELRERSA